MLQISAYQLAQRFVGTKEISGTVDNPQIMAMLKLDQGWPQGDEVPWCSAFVNYVAWLLRLPRSKDLRARSWLLIGVPIPLTEAQADSDVVILKRGTDPQPGADIINAPGHVGFFAGIGSSDTVLLLGGNQSNTVCVTPYAIDRILGVRRL